MKKILSYIGLFIVLIISSCGVDFLELEPRGQTLETNFYQTEDDLFGAVVAAYDVLQWGGTNGWTMKLGLLNAASDDCYAGGSDASDQPNWVAFDNFSLDPFLGPQKGLWDKGYTGIYRCNLVLEKLDEIEGLSSTFKNRSAAEVKFLRAFYYFDLVRFFENIPLITNTLGADEILTQVQTSSSSVYDQIEADLRDAIATFELPSTLPPAEQGRITKGAARALLGKVILYRNDDSRMGEAIAQFEEVINSGLYALEPNFGDIFKAENEFGQESIFEINYSGNQRGGWGNFANGTEGNYDVQFFGMRDYVGPTYANGWSFCPVTEKLAEAMQGDPRYLFTIVDGNLLKNQGASYTEGFQNTDYFILKYAPLQDEKATDGEPALNWGTNVREIRFADVLLMTAEAYARAGTDNATATSYMNQVRARVGLQPYPPSSGEDLLNRIFQERQMELATEGHRFFDLVRSGRATTELGDQGFTAGKNEVLPIPQLEIDLTEGNLVQNPNY